MKKCRLFCSSIVGALLLCIMFNLTALAGVGQSSGSYVWKNAMEKSGDDFWRASYSSFDGWKKRCFEFSSDMTGKCILQVDVTTTSGEFNITIMDSEEKEVYSSKNIITSEFDIELEKGGIYIIKIEGNQHNGSFSIKPKE